MHEVTAPLSGPRTLESRRAQRERERARVITAAERLGPEATDRLTPLLRMLRAYRECPKERDDTAQPITVYVQDLAREVEALEEEAAGLPRRVQSDGSTIRQALSFLRVFGRISALDFGVVPTEERHHLVTLLALEYRWCFAAAGTTPRVFKVAIGRTGAR